MPYCEDCGSKYTGSRNYCRGCGTQLASAGAASNLNTGNLSEHIATGMEQAHWRIRRRRQEWAASNESLEMYIGFVGVVALLHGLSYMAGTPVMSLLNGGLGIMLLVGILVGAVFKVAFDVRYGYTLARSLVEVVLIGALTYAVVFGVFWYLSENYLRSGKPLFDFSKMLPTPTRTPIGKP